MGCAPWTGQSRAREQKPQPRAQHWLLGGSRLVLLSGHSWAHPLCLWVREAASPWLISFPPRPESGCGQATRPAQAHWAEMPSGSRKQSIVWGHRGGRRGQGRARAQPRGPGLGVRGLRCFSASSGSGWTGRRAQPVSPGAARPQPLPRRATSQLLQRALAAWQVLLSIHAAALGEAKPGSGEQEGPCSAPCGTRRPRAWGQPASSALCHSQMVQACGAGDATKLPKPSPPRGCRSVNSRSLSPKVTLNVRDNPVTCRAPDASMGFFTGTPRPGDPGYVTWGGSPQPAPPGLPRGRELSLGAGASGLLRPAQREAACPGA